MHIVPAALAGSVVLMMVARGVSMFVVGPLGQFTAYAIEMLGGCVALAILVFATPRNNRGLEQRRLAALDADEERSQVQRLLQMTDMLQSASGYADANAVLRATVETLLAGFCGALYIFNNSRDRLELSTGWNWPEDERLLKTLSPAQCWALKRGKTHINGNGPGMLRCEHHASGLTVLEVPMMAHGEIQGMLKIATADGDAAGRLARIRPLAEAVADAMSLAVSNIALREKLRTQALRDPLTGLYNRRYMEDALERYAGLAERSGAPLAAIMIDLDHFKKLNDEHGHAMGDAVLRAVAGAVIGALRPSDVACRYGGEELVVILPDCDLAEALAKGETLRPGSRHCRRSTMPISRHRSASPRSPRRPGRSATCSPWPTPRSTRPRKAAVTASPPRPARSLRRSRSRRN
ncbi:MAG TPA: GGDEF domain-containing protein, partial [Sphingomonas sp.]|nr:GGDEF domain-containing protein [Sphingomonas sp.]